MSQPERDEFARLLAAHTNREIDDRGLATLRRLANADSDLASELDAIDKVLATFDREQLLRERVMRPSEAREEAEDQYQALVRAAARAEQQVRERVLQQPLRPAIVAAPRRLRRLAWVMMAAAMVMLGVFLALHRSPSLMTDTPKDERAGPVRAIVLSPQVSADTAFVEWQAVSGASHYDVAIEDGDGKVVLERPPQAKRSTRWDLSRDQIEKLKSQAALYLRVVARDGVGLVLASSHDVPLTVK